MLEMALDGFAAALTFENLFFLLIGVSLGTVVGLLPGIGAPTGLALLLPMTIGMDTVSALIMLAGLYYGAMYGGSITSILINTPGDSSQIMTTVEGHQLAKAGRAGNALGISALSSFVGGVLTLPILVVAMPYLSDFALNFGPPEYLALVLLALTGVASVGGSGSTLKGLAMAICGVALATIGMNPVTGEPRFTFGIDALYGGIVLVPALIGLFALSEMAFGLCSRMDRSVKTRFRDMVVSRSEIKASTFPTVRGSLLGFLAGVLPGSGATLASYLSYDVERRVSKGRKQFGKGAIEGVATVEAANNASVTGAFLPTLSLGIPGSASTAILLGALLLHGIRPGPAFMDDQASLAWALFASFILGNIALLIMNFPLAPAWAMLLRIRYEFIIPFVVLASLIGAFAAENSMLGVWIAISFGVLGLLLRMFGFPLAPLIIGLILGGMLESSVRQTSTMSLGDFSIVLQRPISATLLALSALLLVAPVARSWLVRKPTPPVDDDRDEKDPVTTEHRP